TPCTAACRPMHVRDACDRGSAAVTRPSQRRKAIPGSRDVRYLVLADRAVPYLLARVRWPDVAQAISAANSEWVEDQGLFDLPYDPSAVVVSFPQAASIAGG